jgi:hypothetical protein
MATATAFVFDPVGNELQVAVAKGSYRISNGERHPQPLPVHHADIYCPEGDLRYPSDFAPSKAASDVLLLSAVHAPGGRPAERCHARLSIAGRSLEIVATGARTWTRRAASWATTEPVPQAIWPLTYRNSFGGTTGRSSYPTNPVGRGFLGDPPSADAGGTPLPLLEWADELIQEPFQRPRSAGFGPIPPQWPSRARFAGTFGESWRRTRAPLLPDDFDDRFFQVAPPELQFQPGLVGGEPFELLNLATSHRVAGWVPRLPTRMRVRSSWTRPHLDLVVIEPDEDRVTVTLRASFDVTGELDDLPRLVVIDKEVRRLGSRGTVP